MEINLFGPGGLGSRAGLYDTDFVAPVIDALQRKLDVRRHYGANLANARLATR